jgi:hypothetical protein
MMKPLLHASLFLCLVAMLMTVTPTFAQDDPDELTETYVSADGAFTFQYPDSWRITPSDDFITTSSSRDGAILVVQVYGPGFIETFAPDAVNLNEAMDAMIASPSFETLISGKPEAMDVDRRNILVAAISTDTEEGVFMMVKFANGGFGGIKGSTDPGDLEPFLPTITAMVATLDSADEDDVSSRPYENLILENYAGEWSDAIAELQDNEVIADGGSLVFQENRAFFSGQGYFFTPLASSSPYSDVVMAGELKFTPSDTTDLETCTLLIRVQTDDVGVTTNYLEVGLDNDGFAYWADLHGSTREDFDVDVIDSYLDSGNPYHFLFIAQDDRLAIFINGVVAISEQQISESSGTYGISLFGQAPGASCVGSNIWVYQSPSFTPGVCEISATSTVNKRSGPGTTFDRAGQMQAGTIMRAIAQEEAPDGFIWWQLEDETWVRDDVIDAQGDCLNVPEAGSIT